MPENIENPQRSPESVLSDAERILDESEQEELIRAMQDDEVGSGHGKVNYMVSKLVEKYNDGGMSRTYLKRLIESASSNPNALNPGEESSIRNPNNKETLRINEDGEVVSVSEDGTENPL